MFVIKNPNFFVIYQPTNVQLEAKNILMTFDTEHLIVSFCCSTLWAFDILLCIKLAGKYSFVELHFGLACSAITHIEV